MLMPVYEYDLINSKGEVLGAVQLPLAVENRDDVHVRRAQLPASICISGAAADPADQARQVLTAYKRAEQRIGSNSEFASRLGHTPEQIKRAWSQPESAPVRVISQE